MIFSDISYAYFVVNAIFLKINR